MKPAQHIDRIASALRIEFYAGDLSLSFTAEDEENTRHRVSINAHVVAQLARALHEFTYAAIEHKGGKDAHVVVTMSSVTADGDEFAEDE